MTMPKLISREEFKRIRAEEEATAKLFDNALGLGPDIDTAITREADYAPRLVYNRTTHPRPGQDSKANFEQESLNSSNYGGPTDGWMLDLQHNYDFELSIGEIRALQNYRIKKRIEPIVLERFGNKCCLTESSFCSIVDPAVSLRRDHYRLPLDPEHYIVLNIKLADAYSRGLFWFDDNGRLNLEERTSPDAVEFYGLDTSLSLPEGLPEKTRMAFVREWSE
jgi:hypothetical protein